MAIKKLIREYLSFTRKERIGITVIVIFFFIILLFPFLRSSGGSGMGTKEDSSWANAMHKLEVKDSGNADGEPETKKSYRQDAKTEYSDRVATSSSPTLFYFDPNTISPDEWKRLGIREKTIATIRNYLSKGGSFKKAEDLQKVYGLGKQEYQRLEPHVKIEKSFPNDSPKDFTPVIRSTQKYIASAYSKVIDINTADTTAFIALPGIGSKLALRIITFREKLGGFYSIEQVKETYGIADSVFQKIKPCFKCENNAVKTININTATKDELKAHPYLKWNIANAIVEFRSQHGLFTVIEDLKKVQAINDETFNKLKPYLIL